MMERSSVARVIRALTSDSHIRVSAMDATALWDGVRRGHPHLDAEACAELVSLMSAALLLQARVFFAERLQLLVRSAGRARAIVADAWPGGDVRGMIDLAPDREGGWLQGPGLLQVMRSNPSGSPYIGHLELVDGPVEAQVEAYLNQSEQVRASCTLWCDATTGEAGGLLVEPLPNCPPERLGRLVDALEGLEVVPLWERDAEFLLRWVNTGDGAEILSATDTRYFCRCTEQALLETLGAFSESRLEEVFLEDSAVDVRCDYCGKAYRISRDQLAARRSQRGSGHV